MEIMEWIKGLINGLSMFTALVVLSSIGYGVTSLEYWIFVIIIFGLIIVNNMDTP